VKYSIPLLRRLTGLLFTAPDTTTKPTRNATNTAYNPLLYLLRAETLLFLGYPELAASDAYRALLLCDSALGIDGRGKKEWMSYVATRVWESSGAVSFLFLVLIHKFIWWRKKRLQYMLMMCDNRKPNMLRFRFRDFIRDHFDL